MSKHHLRADKTCQNCGHIVEHRYCSHCGQENTETRQTFGHLVRHFVEDITHYDSGFWKTIKFLLFRPGLLTKEYLSGKRASYVPPVRLYIFISFLCFLLPVVLPAVEYSTEEREKAVKNARAIEVNNEITEIDTAHSADRPFRTQVLWSSLTNNKDGHFIFNKPNDYTSVAQMDSMQALLPPNERYTEFERWMATRTIEVHSHNTPEQVAEKFGESFMHNLPKVLFVYMPLFTFLLWLFHKKKKWIYFDHAIFTLHYFSFMLLSISIYMILRCVVSLAPYDVYYNFSSISLLVIMLWMIWYFFKAHSRMYEQHRLISFLKSVLLFLINCSFILILLVVFGYYTLLMLH